MSTPLDAGLRAERKAFRLMETAASISRKKVPPFRSFELGQSSFTDYARRH